MINPSVTEAAERARASKDNRVAETRAGENADLKPMLEIFRDGRFLAGVFAPDVDRDQALHAAQIAVPGFDAESVVLVVDARITRTPTNPHTGKPWAPGEMQGIDEAGLSDGITTEALVVTELHRDGKKASMIMPYDIDEKARAVTWRERTTYDSEVDEGSVFDGLVMDALLHAFTLPDLLAKARAEYPDELPDDLRIHTDIGVTKALMDMGYMVALTAASEHEAKLIEKAMAHWRTMKTLQRIEAEMN